MTKKPFIAHSEMTNEIYVICGAEKYPVTEQVVKAMQNTGRLELQPSDDKVTITFDKGTLKHSGNGYVTYNKDWFKKHFDDEVAIMTGYDGYNPPSEDCVSRQAVIDKKELIELSDGQSFYSIDPDDIKNMPPVTPTHGTCKDCTNFVKGALDEEICLRGCELIHENFYCADFEKRGTDNAKTYRECAIEHLKQ